MCSIWVQNIHKLLLRAMTMYQAVSLGVHVPKYTIGVYDMPWFGVNAQEATAQQQFSTRLYTQDALLSKVNDTDLWS